MNKLGDDHRTAVIITAKDAGRTIGLAVTTALLQPEVREVVVVDDGSSDATSAIAKESDDGTERLRVIRSEINRGPAFSRNVAIEASTSPVLCVLDADDFMENGRLSRLFAKGGTDWDLLADDILFTSEHDTAEYHDRLLSDYSLPLTLDLEAFAAGNIPRKDRYRRELGFLKPLMRRSFLQSHSIKYDDRVRLGEDFLIYSWCLLRGARFRVVDACGYRALERPTSLSGSPSTHAVAELYRALCEFKSVAAAEGKCGPQLIRAVKSTRDRLALRLMLDAKKEGGLIAFARKGSQLAASIPFVTSEILRAKWGSAATFLRGASIIRPARNR
jgi:succinoglycan biosynthesis protein ExoU